MQDSSDSRGNSVRFSEEAPPAAERPGGILETKSIFTRACTQKSWTFLSHLALVIIMIQGELPRIKGITEKRP